MARKLILFLPLLFASCLLAAAYGAVHNQFSYSVSPEYFTRFKFLQFQISENVVSPRLGAAWVGVLASWWMGVIIGLPVLLLALIDHASRFVAHWRRSTLLTVALSGLAAVAGVYLAPLIVPPDIAAQIMPPEVQDQVAFLRAGGMHEGSYLGGAVGLLVSLILIIVIRARA